MIFEKAIIIFETEEAYLKKQFVDIVEKIINSQS